jgi:hypothetical protein
LLCVMMPAVEIEAGPGDEAAPRPAHPHADPAWPTRRLGETTFLVECGFGIVTAAEFRIQSTLCFFIQAMSLHDVRIRSAHSEGLRCVVSPPSPGRLA